MNVNDIEIDISIDMCCRLGHIYVNHHLQFASQANRPDTQTHTHTRVFNQSNQMLMIQPS